MRKNCSAASRITDTAEIARIGGRCVVQSHLKSLTLVPIDIP